MIKVNLNPVYDVLDDWDEYQKSSHCLEMRQWCRDNFGKNPLKGPKIWTTNWRYDYVSDNVYDGWAYYPSFYFTDPKHADWFALRWL